MLSSSFALPGPIRAPDSKTMLILSLAIRPLCHAPKLKARLIFQKVDRLHDSDLAHRVVDDRVRGGGSIGRGYSTGAPACATSD
jgi:hypothetical protein